MGFPSFLFFVSPFQLQSPIDRQNQHHTKQKYSHPTKNNAGSGEAFAVNAKRIAAYLSPSQIT
jgi:hypothetical protein